MPDNPHFDIPFRLTSRGAVIVEQDTFDDVANCVETIFRVPLGFRDDSPDFGFADVALTTQPTINEEMMESIKQQEPRANTVLSEKPDFYDSLIVRITAEVS